jgi:transposase
MAGRPKQDKANIEKIQNLYNSTKQIIDPRPIIAVVMKECGASYREIGEVFGVTRQMAETIVKNAEKDL